jgi:preprotein translocase subunit SecD
MLVYYRLFGLIAKVALGINLLLLVALMSIIGATLTLPGIAGIVLTVGMAVDANVLIFARIREELTSGTSIQKAIDAGYSRAFVTILDANVTTLLVAIILYAIGTGAVRGFAVTLSIGILTSMFTAIVLTRAIVNLIYGGRRVNKISIGIKLPGMKATAR